MKRSSIATLVPVLLLSLVVTAQAAPTEQTRPAIAYSQAVGAYLAVWQRDSDAIMGRLIGPQGQWMGPQFQIAKLSGTGLFYEGIPALVSDSTDFWVVWSDNLDGALNVRYAKVEAGSGSVSWPGGGTLTTLADTQALPDIAYDRVSGLLFVVWEDWRTSVPGFNIFGARIDPTSGAVLDPGGFQVSFARPGALLNPISMDPSVAAGHGEFFVVWTDPTQGPFLTQYLFGAFVDVSGSVLTPGPGLILSPGAAAAAFPDVGFDGSEYFVVWDDGRNANPNNPKDIYGQCLKHNGQGGGAIRYAQSAALSVASEAQEKPNITFDPFSKQFLLTWTDGRKPPLGMTDIFGVTVQHCDPIGWWFDVTTAPELQRFPASASNRAGTFVTIWEDNRSWPQTGTDVFGKWLNTKGAHLTGDRKVAR